MRRCLWRRLLPGLTHLLTLTENTTNELRTCGWMHPNDCCTASKLSRAARGEKVKCARLQRCHWKRPIVTV